MATLWPRRGVGGKGFRVVSNALPTDRLSTVPRKIKFPYVKGYRKFGNMSVEAEHPMTFLVNPMTDLCSRRE
jgi:hypothetical protein